MGDVQFTTNVERVVFTDTAGDVTFDATAGPVVFTAAVSGPQGPGVIETDWGIHVYVDGAAVPAASKLSPAEDVAAWESAGGPAYWSIPTGDGPLRVALKDDRDPTRSGAYLYTPTVSFARVTDANTTSELHNHIVIGRTNRDHYTQAVAPDGFLPLIVHFTADDPDAVMGTAVWTVSFFVDQGSLETIRTDIADTIAALPVEVFTPFLHVPLDASLVGGSVTGTTLTVAALAGGGPIPVPLNRTVILAGQTVTAENGRYRALTEGVVPGYSDGVFERDPIALQPFTADNVNKGIFSLNPFVSLPFVGQIISDGAGGYLVPQIAVPPTTGNDAGDVLKIVDSGVGLFYEWGSAPYTPGDSADWTGDDPITVGQALDRIAAAVGPIA